MQWAPPPRGDAPFSSGARRRASHRGLDPRCCLSDPCVRIGLWLADGIEHRDLLRRGRAKYVDELARLHLRRLRSGGDHLRRQVARRLLGPGPLCPDLRRPHLGRCSAAGSRGLARRPRPVPHRPSHGRSGGRSDRSRCPCPFPCGGDAGPGQHLRHTACLVAGAGSGLHGVCRTERSLAQRRHGRGVGGFGVPGQNGGGVARPAGAGRRPRARCPRERCERGWSVSSRWWS